MTPFNLLDQPWIPVRTLGGTPKLLGIRDTLIRSHELDSIVDASPLVVTSLYRLLLAVLYRAYRGPTSIRQGEDLLEHGRFDIDIIDAYLTPYAHRFELFGDEPFYQVGDLELPKDTPISKLAVERASGNNKALFDHSLDEQPPALSYAEAARWLVAHQAFALCGGVSGGGLINFTDAPSPRGVIVLVMGNNLFETLTANLVPYKDKQIIDGDLPAWEQPALRFEELQEDQKRSVTGPASLYTWQSRAVKLLPDNGTVSRMFYASGLQAIGDFRDPACAYQVPKKQSDSRIPVKFSLDKSFWRDFGTLVPPKGDLRPQVIEYGYALEDYLAPQGLLQVTLFGQIARPGQPVVDAWRSEHCPLPTRLLEDASCHTQLENALDLAEDVGKAMRAAGYTLAVNLTDTESAGKLLESFPLLRSYWSQLEAHFADFLTDLARIDDPERAFESWREVVRSTALDAFRVTSRAVGAKERRALLVAESKLYIELNKLGLKKEVAA
ncbi:MAG: type I-E CRISPR-associated protein Cse1/CasA [Truepera sp.]|nr:type I-E CRISPR-associated protein Cse1/CasA [Truepera sp.]